MITAEELKNIERIPFSGCWIWMGSCDAAGYGVKRKSNKALKTHRISWANEKGNIPYGMKVLHKCDVRPCINPEHLFIGTQSDNVKDMVEKGRNKTGGNFKNHHVGKAHSKSVLNGDIAKEILYSSLTKKELSKKYNVCPSVISRIRNGSHWTVRNDKS